MKTAPELRSLQDLGPAAAAGVDLRKAEVWALGSLAFDLVAVPPPYDERGGELPAHLPGVATTSKFEELAKGTPVVVEGLQSAAHHNGKAGNVAGYDAGAGRYSVELADGSRLSIRPTNVGAATPSVSVQSRALVRAMVAWDPADRPDAAAAAAWVCVRLRMLGEAARHARAKQVRRELGGSF